MNWSDESSLSEMKEEADDRERQEDFRKQPGSEPLSAQESFELLFQLVELADSFQRSPPDRRVISGEFLL